MNREGKTVKRKTAAALCRARTKALVRHALALDAVARNGNAEGQGSSGIEAMPEGRLAAFYAARIDA